MLTSLFIYFSDKFPITIVNKNITSCTMLMNSPLLWEHLCTQYRSIVGSWSHCVKMNSSGTCKGRTQQRMTLSQYPVYSLLLSGFFTGGLGWLCTGYKSSVRVCYEYHCIHKHSGQEMILGPSTCSALCNTNLTATVVLKVHTTCQERFYSYVSQYQSPEETDF